MLYRVDVALDSISQDFLSRQTHKCSSVSHQNFTAPPPVPQQSAIVKNLIENKKKNIKIDLDASARVAACPSAQVHHDIYLSHIHQHSNQPVSRALSHPTPPSNPLLHRRCLNRSTAAFSSASRSSGCAMLMSARARCGSVLPNRSAMPYSVTT